MKTKIRLINLMLFAAILLLFPMPTFAKSKLQKCLKGCALGVEYCVKGCTDGAGGTPRAKAKCKRICKKAMKKCAEVCKKRYKGK